MIDIASEHVLWAITQRQTPAEVLDALGISIPFEPTWDTVKGALDMRHGEILEARHRDDARQLRLVFQGRVA